MTQLYLIRHGESCIVNDGIVNDYGLTETGVAQAIKLRDRLVRSGEIQADIWIASSFLRAKQTAEILAEGLDVTIVPDDEFQEMRPGQALGMTKESLDELLTLHNPKRNPFALIAPGAENWPQFVLRVGTALNRICLQYEGKTIAIVCHGGVIDCSFQYFFGLNTFEMPKVGFQTNHTSITHWSQHEDKTWSLIKYNDARHLEAY
ncbi:histidine phosphatase family protein [Paenibacillus sp. GD4]|uniref:histidine phosphatase family protein n=1 Tax=Paenibacillus sp. GD4 TaxID=3068890 RepID=UPI002796A44B|nr:histidine phosphatase family protein [Paenibacillus sp. GD4]MDQ1912622.1 histidine phosphatase family protein [Paenibacillus sp. GD4]